MQRAITSCKGMYTRDMCARICPSWVGSSSTSILSFIGNGTLWSFQIYEILLSKGISRGEKKKLRSCVAMLSQFPVSSRNAKEKCNDINCEETDLLRLLNALLILFYIYILYTCAETLEIFYSFPINDARVNNLRTTIITPSRNERK